MISGEVTQEDHIPKDVQGRTIETESDAFTDFLKADSQIFQVLDKTHIGLKM